MGKIKKILENELVGGTQSIDVYPVTSTKAVYDTDNKVLDDYIQHLKKTSTFAGIATPTTNPGTPDGPVFYLATEAGMYANFNGISVAYGEAVILQWNDGAWTKKTWQVVDEKPTAGSDNLVKSGGVANAVGISIIDKEVSVTASVEVIANLKVDHAPIELVIDVLQKTAEFEESVWLGIHINGSYFDLTENNGKFYFKNSTAALINETEFYIYIRKCTTAGNVRLRVSTNNGKELLVKTVNDIANSVSAIISNINENTSNINDVLYHLPKKDGWIKQDNPLYTLINSSGNNGTRLYRGSIAGSSLKAARITNVIPIVKGTKYKLKTIVAKYFDGIAYYSNMAATSASFVGYDIFHSESTTPSEINTELTIPDNAVCMRFATMDLSTFEVYMISKNNLVDVASKEYVREHSTDPDVVNAIVEENIEPMEGDINYLYGVVSAGSTPPELAVKYSPTNTIYLGTDVLDISDVTYDSNYWSIVNGLPKYLGGVGGGQSKTFKFNALTVDKAKYLCDITTLTQDEKYEDLFYLRIGSQPLVDTYNGGPTTFGSFISDGGQFEIVPHSTKAFDVTAISLKNVLNSNSDPDYTETRTLSVDNVNCGNSSHTLIDGKWNVAVGPTGNCMAANVNGSRSIAIGLYALRYWWTGMQNVAIGTFALHALRVGEHNIAIGSDSLWQAQKANDNVVIGRSAVAREFSAIEGQDDYEIKNNVVIGYKAMMSNQKTSNNSVTIGYKANTYGVPNSVFIGSKCGTSQANADKSNVIVIGYEAEATKSNQCVIGNANVSEFILGNKKLIFHEDGTVTWEAIS